MVLLQEFLQQQNHIVGYVCIYIILSIYLYIYTWGWVRTYDYQWVIYMGLLIWVWINTYENTIFSGLFTSINPSYFDVNRRGTIGFDTLPYIFAIGTSQVQRVHDRCGWPLQRLRSPGVLLVLRASQWWRRLCVSNPLGGDLQIAQWTL